MRVPPRWIRARQRSRFPSERVQKASPYAAAFSPGLINPERATPALVSGPNGKAAVKRYNVYRNNVTVSLIDALAAIYPAVQRVTGVEFFRAMARFHVRETPPPSPLLFEYGRDFPAFIETYRFAQTLPWPPIAPRLFRRPASPTLRSFVIRGPTSSGPNTQHSRSFRQIAARTPSAKSMLPSQKTP